MQKKGKVLTVLATILMIAQICLSALPVTVKAEPASVFTDYLPAITQVTDEEGFIHPGVGLTKELLENLRSKIRAGAQPWTYYFNTMLLPAPEASRTISSSNSSDGKTPSADYFNSQGIEGRFIADAVKAYAQAVMYYLTGDDVYRANAMMIIRVWEKMDPAKYAYYTDAHIHAGVPLNRMVMAAEILRYTSTQTASLAWTDQDTADFTNHLIIPVTETLLHDQNHFMNQHNYPILGAMAGYIFTGNRDRYNESVEWFTVNRTAKDQGFNGAIKALFRWVTEEEKPGTKVGEGTPVEPHVQHMEMGRDQAHGGGDLTNAAIITRLIHAQGTRIDPVAGTPSTADNAVDIMEFLNHRLLAAANYFWQFMLGYDTPWTPQAYAITGGDPDNVGMGGYIRDTYNFVSPGYRGRFDTANFWDFYSYYTYVKHQDVSQLAPYYYEAFTKKQPSTPGMWANKDAGNDFWLYLPAEAEADAAKFIPQDKTSGKILQLEDRFTKLDSNTATMQEGDTGFIRFHATQEGSQIAALSFAGAAGSGPFGFKIRTNGVATLDAFGSTFTLPNTKGEWKYVYLSGTFDNIVYMKVKGTPGITVDLDFVDAAAGTNLTPPVFKSGSSDLKIYTYVGAFVNVDLSATDASSTDVITYELQNNAKGLPLDTQTGALSWHPTEAGNYTVVVAATDGTTVSVKNVNIIVSSDRASAVQAIIASYDPNQVYVEATLGLFQTVYTNTLSQMNTASEVDFDKQLQALRAATEGLTLVTPLTNYGMRWSKVVAWSSWGSLASNMDDGTNLTGSGYGLALGSAPHLYHLLDFGPDYKVSATKFGFLTNIFVDRLANSTVYGSNDKLNWTRLTPGVTQYTQAYQTLDVDPARQNEKYRYIKLEMIQPLPAVLYGEVVNLLEMTDFDVYGTRYEIGNKLDTVSISSDQSINGKISAGDTAKVTIKAKEPIQNVKVSIQGIDATVTTTDNINWTAVATMAGNVPAGYLHFSVDYQKNDGTNGDTTFGSTDGSELFITSPKYINVPMLAKVTASDKQWPGNGLSADQVGSLLFDGSTSSFGDLNTASGSYYTIDFGEGVTVKLDEAVLMPRASFPARLNGMVIQGSNDNVNWTNITTGVKGALANTWYVMDNDQIVDHNAYRYLRLYNSSAWSGDVAEVEFYGDYTASAAMVASKITSIPTQAMYAASIAMPKIPAGYTLSIKSTSPPGIIGTDGTITQPDYDTLVNVVFTVTKLADGTTADTRSISTVVTGYLLPPDGYTKGSYYLYQNEVNRIKTALNQPGADKPSLFKQLVQAQGLLVSIKDIYKKINITSSMAMASSISWDGTANAAANGWRAFDGDTTTSPDTKTSAGWAQADLGAGNAKVIGEIKFIPRPNQISRMNGALIQGSNDGTNFVTLYTINNITELKWYSQVINNSTAYRYLRYYTPSGSANVGELEFYEKIVDRTLLTLLLDKAAAISANQYTSHSVAVLQNTVTSATSVSNKPDATQTEVDAASESLKSALEGLQYLPTASVNPAAPNGLNGWYTVPVTVTLSAYGNMEYTLNGENTWHSYASPITLDQDGVHTLNYRLTNTTDVQSVTVKIDKTAPTITVTGLVYGTYTDSMDVTPILTLSDNFSGVDGSKTMVTLSTYGEQQAVQQGAAIPLYTLPLGSHTLIVTASDLAGNTDIQTITFQTTTSIESLQALVTRFKTGGWIDNAGIANSLQSKLTANKLADFVNEVQAQSGKHISAQAAGYLLRDARYLLSNR
ncbi:discoidin domain-containing protein [Paenibacillus whitsoniae]|uniref:F5/8 type C domain-containing protein n=1 Tax=Paenibacillus whitsoniae TaxID=2496558 RepID=A0A3S0CX67_9BACL|nr:discoidin domain-containing protein [Paenibacillus whitsoniae]RTE10819.1 hypothetical protein EJQ19_06015 [Paenibacillus whitsoniae]